MSFESAPREFQFSLRWLFGVVTLGALLAGLCHAFPILRPLAVLPAVLAVGVIILLVEIAVIFQVERIILRFSKQENDVPDPKLSLPDDSPEESPALLPDEDGRENQWSMLSETIEENRV